MVLTGKAKEDFLIKIYYTEDTNQASDESDKKKIFFHSTKWLAKQDERFVRSLTIDWLDSVGIIINIKRFSHLLEFQQWYFIITNKQGVHLNNYLNDFTKEDSRQEATNAAIEKANEIYNEKHK